MKPERDGKGPGRSPGPRKEAPTSALRFDKADAASPDKAKRGPSWKKTASRMKQEAPEPKTAEAVKGQPAVETEAGAAPAPLDAAATPNEQEEQSRPGAEVYGPEAPSSADMPPTSGQSVPKSKLRRESKRAEAVSEHGVSDGKFHQDRAGAAVSAGDAPRQDDTGQTQRQWKRQAGDAVRKDAAGQTANGKFRQESKQARPSDRLHHKGDKGGPMPGDKPEADKLHREKGRMERRGAKLEKAQGKLAKQKPVKPPGPVRRVAGAVGYGVHGYVHRKLYEVEYENVGTEAAHRSELVAEAAGRKTLRFVKRRVRSRPARAVRRAEGKYVKSVADYHFKQTVLEHPELEKKNALSRIWRKRQQRKKYAKQAREAAKKSAAAAEKTAVTTEKIAARVVQFVKDHPVAVVLIVLCVLLLVIMQSCTTSLSAIGNGISGSVAATTYPAADADLLGAESAYAGLEADLQNRLDSYESAHSYDEYHFDLEDIEHDPYVLLSILSALHPEGWTLSDVQAELQALFDRQYILTEDVVTETRYRTETRTGTRTVTDPETGEETEEEYEYDVQVPYTYTICTVTLENFNLSHLPVYIMGEEQLSRYSVYMAALGNRADLFPASAYVNRYGGPVTRYEIPPEALSDEKFAAMIREAEKYLGYPYVWGGSSPSTSFDCSGFVSWVINHCGQGWNFGRLGSDGLYFNVCTPIAPSEAKPGDLIFFQKTYDTPNTSHVGIYVGNGMMIHCGDPIQYTSINTSYWQAHFYGFGRLP